MFHFQGADIPAMYDLVNWQNTPKGPLKIVLIGRVEGLELHLNESAIQWSTGSNQVVRSPSLKATTKFLLKLMLMSIHRIMSLSISIGLLFRFLFQCAVRAAPQVPEWPTGKGSLSAALTVSHVLQGRLVRQLVRKSIHKITETNVCHPNVYLFFLPSLLFSLPGSLHCEHCPLEFWSNVEQTSCIPRQLDFLAFNETLGITLTTAAVSGAAVTAAVFVVFLCYRQTPMVRIQSDIIEFVSHFFISLFYT